MDACGVHHNHCFFLVYDSKSPCQNLHWGFSSIQHPSPMFSLSCLTAFSHDATQGRPLFSPRPPPQENFTNLLPKSSH